MDISGKNIIGSAFSAEGKDTFRGFNPSEGKALWPAFHEASAAEVARAGDLADEAAPAMRELTADHLVRFLLGMREEIANLGDQLIERAAQETGLPHDRLKGERERTLNQIKLFADIVQEGSWVDARIDTALPDRKPLPRPDIRRMLQPIGPVAVFGASNFPLAFSVAGGDTVSAFAARNPVIVKAHPAHPGTSDLVGRAIGRTVKAAGMPEGTFSMIHGIRPDTSLALVTHPKIRAVGFTGSLRAGRALFDAAARRPDPIPVYAEMGSVNPVFVLPGALSGNPRAVAEALSRSVLLGVGQFCTCPGLVFGIDGDGFREFQEHLTELFEQAGPATMLNSTIQKGFSQKFNEAAQISGVEKQISSRAAVAEKTEGQPGLLTATSDTWLKNKTLHEEIFGPSTVLVHSGSAEELLELADALEGTLTATILGTADELAQHQELISVLSRKAGRLIFNGYPTGVEVGYAMHHGGPYPATTDPKFTSVGVTAIYRFAAPVCYQNFPEQLLPPELQNRNPRNIWRTVNGQLTRDRV